MTAAFKIDKMGMGRWQARFGNRFAYYDVADQIGTMIVRPGAVDAFDMHGIHLGRFKSLRAARSAIEISTKSLRAARSAIEISTAHGANARELGLLDDTHDNINSHDGGAL